MKIIDGKRFSFWKTAGFLGLLIAMFFSYHLVSAGSAAGEVVEFSIQGNEVVSSADSHTHSDSVDVKTHCNGKFRYTTRKRALYRTDYVKKTVHFSFSENSAPPLVAAAGILGYRQVYHRPSYYIHLFRYALF